MVSSRGAVAALVVDGASQELDLTTVLPDRAREPSVPLRAPGPPLAVTPLRERIEGFGERARRRGYAPSFELDLARVGARDAMVALELLPGCHLVGAMVELPP